MPYTWGEKGGGGGGGGGGGEWAHGYEVTVQLYLYCTTQGRERRRDQEGKHFYLDPSYKPSQKEYALAYIGCQHEHSEQWETFKVNFRKGFCGAKIILLNLCLLLKCNDCIYLIRFTTGLSDLSHYHINIYPSVHLQHSIQNSSVMLNVQEINTGFIDKKLQCYLPTRPEALRFSRDLAVYK